MAGIYIPGMEMPKSCIECRFCGEDAMCDVLGEDLFDYLQNQATYVEYLPDEWKNADCPLLPVPEHGDLIDREKMRDYWLCASWDCPNMDVGSEKDVFAVINAVPAVLPGEEGEGW